MLSSQWHPRTKRFHSKIRSTQWKWMGACKEFFNFGIWFSTYMCYRSRVQIYWLLDDHGVDMFQMMAFIIQYFHISQSSSDTRGHRYCSGRNPLQRFKLCQCKCSLNRILSSGNVFLVLSGQLCLSTSWSVTLSAKDYAAFPGFYVGLKEKERQVQKKSQMSWFNLAASSSIPATTRAPD